MGEGKPFIGTTKTLLERIYSLDNKWFVEFWLIKYYFLGIEVYLRKKEVVTHIQSDQGNGNHL